MRTPPLGPPPSIAFFTGNDYTRTTRRTPLGTPLFVQAIAPQADLRPGGIDTVTIRLATRLTGDLDEFRAVETGPHTGTFRIVAVVTPLTRRRAPPHRPATA